MRAAAGLAGRLAGRVAVVAGVGSIVGRACALAFGRDGAEVVAVDPVAKVADAVAGEVVAAGGRAIAVTARLDAEAGARAVAETCRHRWGRVDTLFTSQAMLDHEPPGRQSAAHWERILRTNLLGPALYTQALFPLLATTGNGSVTYLCSIDGQYGNPSFPGYSVSKGGLIPLTHVMAHDGGAHGIRVNAIAMAALIPLGSTDPDPVPVTAPAWSAVRRATPLARPASPDDVAGAAVYLASDEASYVSGVVLPVDGGRTAVTPGTAGAEVVPTRAGTQGPGGR
jgi:NAD(P)-dependent dehydrogenase (short-subunit alcohol dehydrogenase family)